MKQVQTSLANHRKQSSKLSGTTGINYALYLPVLLNSTNARLFSPYTAVMKAVDDVFDSRGRFYVFFVLKITWRRLT